MPGTEPVDDAAAQLYSRPVDDFMSLRTELSKQAKADGNAAAGKAIANLRKPTLAASIVNRWVYQDPGAVERLVELGDRLRRAHHDLDATALRELSGERRKLVAEVTKAALEHSGQDDPTTAVRDEVTSTFDAAVADGETAGRLGRLTKSEQFSGFGTAMTGSPELTLVRGGKDTPGRKGGTARGKGKDDEPEDTMPAATRRRLTRARDRAQSDFDAADKRLASVEADEQSATDRVKDLTAELAELQQELDDAKRDLDDARRAVKSERTRRREARSALDRAERQLDR